MASRSNSVSVGVIVEVAEAKITTNVSYQIKLSNLIPELEKEKAYIYVKTVPESCGDYCVCDLKCSRLKPFPIEMLQEYDCQI